MPKEMTLKFTQFSPPKNGTMLDSPAVSTVNYEVFLFFISDFCTFADDCVFV